ncbi:MAG: glycoside hydrolase family 2 [Chitinophagaceae bacterium]|nr:MAG: glycoside hydrolase family 2 [Chitinophagaceae bacterium]
MYANLLCFFRSLHFLVLMLMSFNGFAQTGQGRLLAKLNDGWSFKKGANSNEQSPWEQINLPHTWNKDDVMDDEAGYYRGIAWYKKKLTIPAAFKGKSLWLYFEGANQETEIFVNGKKAGHHTGGYTAFRVPISSFIEISGNHELLVKVDNAHNKNVPPLSADFTFYGGIYRDVYLEATGSIHFANDEGSNGVFVTTPLVTKEKAEVVIKAKLTNEQAVTKACKVLSIIYNKEGKKVGERSQNLLVGGKEQREISQRFKPIKYPKLWSPEHPYLYTVKTQILGKKNDVLDEVSTPLGFRWFSFDADKGFYLNGHPYKIIGASRHQDYKGLGNAVPDDLAVNDVVLLKTMGANFLRVAHYPQDPSVLNACDSLGLLASVEIPVVNEITEADSFYTNCERMQTEMIRQNFNHPSVVMWCYMNEVLLRPQFNDDKDRQKTYFANIKSLAQRLENLTRKEDPYRYTMMANHGDLNRYNTVGLLDIPMVIGWNLYSGWYGGSMDDFPSFLDGFHKAYPKKAFLVTEYGADADPRIRSTQPVRFDKSVEYTTLFHQYYLKEMKQRPFVAGAIVWNLADFNSETRTETMPHMNNKGLLEWDRTPKDPYYFYQAALRKDPFIKILGSSQTAFGVADSMSSVCEKSVQVASNLDSVTIFLNGIRQGSLPVQNSLCDTLLSFREGWNTVVAKGKKAGVWFSDSIRTQIHLQPPSFKNSNTAFDKLNIMLGSARYFTDNKGRWWQPSNTYKEGYYGFVGGKRFKLENNSRLPYGTDKNILGTDDDPIYQTQQTGIKQYRFDVQPGTYLLTLHFAELMGGKVSIPPYNLSDDERSEKLKQRIFTVRVNGNTLLDRLNLAKDYGLAKAVAKTITVIVRGNEGVVIDFEAIEGEPVLNALQLVRVTETFTK